MPESKKILIGTDSLGLPRTNDQEDLEWKDTWPVLLRKDHTVSHIGIGGARIIEIAEQLVNYYKPFDPEIVIIQAGIVDCAPRSLSYRERKFMESAPLGIRLFGPYLRRYGKKVRNRRNKKLTKPQEYRLSFQTILKSFPNSRVIFVETVPASPAYEEKVKGITESINTYNSIIAELIDESNIISTKDFSENEIMNDHHHVTKLGHDYIYQKISEVIG